MTRLPVLALASESNLVARVALFSGVGLATKVVEDCFNDMTHCWFSSVEGHGSVVVLTKMIRPEEAAGTVMSWPATTCVVWHTFIV